MNSADPTVSENHTAREEMEGKEIWERFQAKQIACGDLKDDNFGALGEYFMGLMLGQSHEAMNNMMIQMMGDEGEEQMHVVMGKRLSGCDVAAQFSGPAIGFMPMMMGGWSSPFGYNDKNMMGYGYGAGTWFGGAGMIFWWILIVVAIVLVIKWAVIKPGKGNSAMETLKERYAKGEISKEEFEEKRRAIS
ncbi:SHOCT domain-containing protein [Candidatus Wolfebacteria bacterium]|nr:SHOCT domain-containing protein [Candidatus Wolfebacteria bacterium]